MKKTIFFIFSLLFSQFTNAQAPGIAWQKTIGGSESDYLESIQQTADGGYILGGYSYSGISGDKTEASQGNRDYWIVKLDATGQTIDWQNTIGGSSVDKLYSIKQTADGGYIFGGYSSSGISGDKTEASQGNDDYWVVKLDATGQTIEWQNTIGGNNSDVLHSIQQTTDGGYILGGYSSSGISGDKTEASQGDRDYWLVKLDATGQTIEWQNTIGGSSDDLLHSIQQTMDGGYIFGGQSKSGISGDKTEASQGDYDYWVVKLDGTGQTIEWQNTISGNDSDYLYPIRQTNDGGYILGGHSRSGIGGDKTEPNQGFFDIWVIKLDGTGNILWQNTVGGSGNDNLLSIQQTSDGGYILGGYSSSGISGDKSEAKKGESDYWLVKINGTGNIYWQKTIGGSEGDDLYSMQQTADGGYILGGQSESEISGDKTEANQGGYDYWVVKLEADTPLEVEQFTDISKIEYFTVLPAYPNPFNPSTTITYGLDRESNVSIAIYDVSGKLIKTLLNTEQTQGWHSIQWYGTDQYNNQVPAGVYFGKVSDNNNTKTTKLMLVK